SGNAYETEWATFTTPPLQTPTPSVRGADESALVTWGPIFGAVAYEVESHAADGHIAGSRVEGLRYLDTGLTNGATYEYTVAAVDQAGNVSEPSQLVSVTVTPAVVDDTFDDGLDTDLWRIHGSNASAQVSVA